MFLVHALPADHGDCLWIEYGPAAAPRRILIDGGTARTYPRLRAHIAALPRSQRRFELLIVSHIDNDHIDGALELLADHTLGVTFDDVWFNGYHHTAAARRRRGILGPAQGERLGALLTRRGHPWNRAFAGASVVVPATGPLPAVLLAGGLRLTLLSPTWTELATLRRRWQQVLAEVGWRAGRPEPARLRRGVLGTPSVARLAAAPFVADNAPANGSSIAVLAEYGRRRCLLAADAFAPVLADGLERLANERRVATITVDLCKLPHHGSRKNLDRGLLARMRCFNYLISTDGSRYGHPDAEALARVITDGHTHPTLFFNYRSAANRRWANPRLQATHGYASEYPDGDDGIAIDLG
jgi:beta-lactamase superfamily II metal-dependent hydrolase